MPPLTKSFIEMPGYLHKEKQSAATAEGLDIKGFASLGGIDRHGEEIKAEWFEPETFLKNGQLWLNHQLIERDDGQMVPAGVVEKIHVVKVETDDSGDGFRIIDIKTGVQIDNINNGEDFIVKDGDKGLWVTCRVIEESVIELITDGRLNAFSWQGTMHRKPDGRVDHIDLMEVSVVFVPANARALFTIGKALDAQFEIGKSVLITQAGGAFLPSQALKELTPSTEGHSFKLLYFDDECKIEVRDVDSWVIDLTSAKRLANDLHARGKASAIVLLANTWMTTPDGASVFSVAHVVGKVSDTPNDEEHEDTTMLKKIDELTQKLLAMQDQKSEKLKGGDTSDMDAETIKKLEATLENVGKTLEAFTTKGDGILATVEALTERMKKLEAGSDADPPLKEADATQKAAADDAVKDADKKDEDTPDVDDSAMASKILEGLTEINAKVNVIGEHAVKLGERLAKLEGTPDDSTDVSNAEPTKADAEAEAMVLKAFSALPLEQQKAHQSHANRVVLADIFFDKGMIGRHLNES